MKFIVGTVCQVIDLRAPHGVGGWGARRPSLAVRQDFFGDFGRRRLMTRKF